MATDPTEFASGASFQQTPMNRGYVMKREIFATLQGMLYVVYFRTIWANLHYIFLINDKQNL